MHLARTALTVILALVGLTMALPAANLPAETPAWVAGVTNFVIGGVTLGMTKTAVTNIDARYRMLTPPADELDTTHCLLLSVPEEKLGIGMVRPGVTVNISRTVYFNQEGRAVAVEMTFVPICLDKRSFMLSQLERKYKGQPRVRKDVYRYSVSPAIELVCTIEPYGEPRQRGESTVSDYRVRNFYYHISKYPEAMRQVQSSKAGVFDTLL
jgi:hypothetical protein